jgi:single-strand DNA-binding protein
MGSLNVVMLIGHVGSNVRLRYTPKGHAVVVISVATSTVWTDKGNQRREKTEWHRVVLWGKAAEALWMHLTKGTQVYVSGELHRRSWTDKAGIARTTTEITADKIVLLGPGLRRDRDRPDHVTDEEVGTGSEPVVQMREDEGPTT